MNRLNKCQGSLTYICVGLRAGKWNAWNYCEPSKMHWTQECSCKKVFWKIRIMVEESRIRDQGSGRGYLIARIPPPRVSCSLMGFLLFEFCFSCSMNENVLHTFCSQCSLNEQIIFNAQVQNYQLSWLFHIHLKVLTYMYDNFCA